MNRYFGDIRNWKVFLFLVIGYFILMNYENGSSDSIDSFINEDTSLAKDVCERDNLVDNLKDQLLRELITFMSSDSSTIERSLNLIRISGNLERIADLSTNICEDVIFVAKGQVIKHHKLNGKGEGKPM